VIQKITVILTMTFFAFIVWVIYLANTDANAFFFDFIRSIPYGDKLGHFCLFGTLTLGVIVGSDFRCFQFKSHRIYYGAAIVSLFVFAEELTQLFIPSRTFDLVDLMSDGAGILAASFVAYLINKTFLNKHD
jgi:VanZ family protein